MSERFNLRWNDFQSNVSRTFSLLRSQEEFCDVSLVSEDQKMMSAHKLVLSACSPYFKHILTMNKHSHPLLCLQGINILDLKYVLDYIYQGEVLIGQEELDRFVNIASRLQLEGLVVTEDELKEPEYHPPVKPNVAKKPATPPRRKDKEPVKQKRIKNENSNSLDYLNYTVDRNVLLPNDSLQTLQNFSDMENLISAVDQKINENFFMNPDTSFTCGVCGMTKKRLSDIQTHVELHLQQQIILPCKSCGKTFKTRNLLSKHLCPVAVAKFT